MLTSLWLACVLQPLSARAFNELVPLGATWYYLDDGSYPALDSASKDWKEPLFDDSSWDDRPAQLGYGDSPATTVSYGNNQNTKHITTYFRHSFEVADVSEIHGLSLELMRDDGGVVYLNGSEVFRSNMPAGSITNTTLALADTGDESFLHQKTLSPSMLVNGTNVLAVEIHQKAVDSTDLRMDLRLTDLIIPFGATWNYLDDGSNQGTAWKETTIDQTIMDDFSSSGSAPLGYGDPTPVTAVSYGTNSSNKHITTYFRHSFEIGNPSGIEALVLDLVRDDGAVAYLNGTEIFRTNMPGGAIGYTTTASGAVGGSEETALHRRSIDPALLNTGTNVMAIEIHQANPTSSDIRFDFRLQTATPELDRGPYLQLGRNDRMIVRWRTNVPTSSQVNYGLVDGILDQVATDPTLVTDHSVELTGLTEGTKYFYSIGDGTTTFASGSEYYLETHPPVGSTGPTRIWVLGDSGTASESNAGYEADVRDAFETVNGGAHADLLLMLGDNAYKNGTDSEYQKALFEVYPDTIRNTVLWSTIGNHDAYNSSVYYDIFDFPTAGEAGGLASGTEAYYSFDYANIHFVCLDSHATSRSATGAMATWLKNDLALTSQEFLIAFWHHPPYSRGSHNSDNTGEYRMREMREIFVPILEDFGVDLVLAGHSHIYERSMLIDGHTGYSDTFDSATMALDTGDGDPDSGGAYQKVPNPNQGAVYAVAGSSGKLGSASAQHPIMIRHLLNLGSVIIDVSGKVMDVRFIDDKADVLDTFRIEHIDPPVGAPVLTSNSLSLINGTPVTIQTSDLSATDSDTPPGSLTFTISNLSGGNFKVGGSTVTSFTQQQVIDGDVDFEPTGTTAPTYSVKVSDGALDSGFPEDAVVFFHEQDGDSRSAAFELLFASSDTQFDSDCPITFGTREDGNNVYATYTFLHTTDLSSLSSGLEVSFSASPDGRFTAVSANPNPIDHGDGTQTSTFEDSVPVNNNGALATRFGKITVAGEDSEIYATVPTTILEAPDSAPTTVSVHSFSPGAIGPVIASGIATDVGPSTLTNTDSILGPLAPGQFYVSLTSGNDEGARATITGNTATELTLDADLSGLDVVGESYEIRKHLSIGSLLGPANEAGLHADSNSSLADNVLLTRDAVETFFYSNGSGMEGWKDSMASDATDEIIEPLVPLAVRRRVSGDLTIYPAGAGTAHRYRGDTGRECRHHDRATGTASMSRSEISGWTTSSSADRTRLSPTTSSSSMQTAR